MKIISSQRFINYDIVDEKIEKYKNRESITLPIIDAGITDLDGNDLFILINGHHSKMAAEELGIEILYEEVPNEYGLVGDDLLITVYMDSDWYYVDGGQLVW